LFSTLEMVDNLLYVLNIWNVNLRQCKFRTGSAGKREISREQKIATPLPAARNDKGCLGKEQISREQKIATPPPAARNDKGHWGKGQISREQKIATPLPAARNDKGCLGKEQISREQKIATPPPAARNDKGHFINFMLYLPCPGFEQFKPKTLFCLHPQLIQ
jgi:hypothetical protein